LIKDDHDMTGAKSEEELRSLAPKTDYRCNCSCIQKKHKTSGQ